MRSAPVVVSSIVLAALALGVSGGPAGATETLASATFEGDSAGAVVAPLGSPVVQECVIDDSATFEGSSQVVFWSGGKRYRFSNAGTFGAVKGIRAPLSSGVSTGTLVATAVVAAEQTNGGAVLGVSDPNESEWLGRVGFKSDGTLSVHGNSTTTSYSADHRYEVTMTLHFGANPTVDYLVTDLDTSTTVIDSTGLSMAPDATADRIRFRTTANDEGAFTFDDLLVTH